MRSNNFYDFLSARAKLMFFAGVFFTFAPLTIIYDLSSPKGIPWYEILAWSAYSGLTAVGWAFSALRSWRYLFFVVPASLILHMLYGQTFWPRAIEPTLLIEAIACIAAIIAGYIFFIIFISGEGASSIRMRTEIGLAQEIHANLVPRIDGRFGGWQLFGVSEPTTEVGGDLMDVLERDGKTGIYVADVSGHGVPAGVMMGMIKSAIRMKLKTSDSMERLINDLNEVVFEVKKEGMFATFAAIQFDGSRVVHYCLAGHHPILHFRHDTQTLEKHPNECPPLGVVEQFHFDTRTVEVSPGDVLVILTDGLTEVFDKNGDEFGEQRIESIVARNAARPLSEISEIILRSVREFGPQTDDQTLLLARVL